MGIKGDEACAQGLCMFAPPPGAPLLILANPALPDFLPCSQASFLMSPLVVDFMCQLDWARGALIFGVDKECRLPYQ